MSDEPDVLLTAVYDAASAFSVLLAELLATLAENGALTREQVATLLIRNERIIAQDPSRALASNVHQALSEAVQQRLGLQPETHARRLDTTP